MKKIVFLVSGGGGNLTFLHSAIEQYLPNKFTISGVIADRDCKAIELSRKINVPVQKVAYSLDKPNELRAALEGLNPNYIVTNIHKILDEETVLKYEGRLINLHYSLLPAFGGVIGIKPVQQALEKGCKFIGTTVHYVSKEVDAGAIIAQSTIPVVESESFDGLMERVFRSGCMNLFNALRLLEGAQPTFKAVHHEIMSFAPLVAMDKDWFSEEFWVTLRKLNEY